jgi:cyclic di-GMP phosphodiesterase
MGQIVGSGRPKVLVVDDQEYARALLVRWLGDAGHPCIEARDTAEAWAHIESGEFGLVTLDVSLPGGSGLDLLKRISAQFPDTAVIMLTGEGSPAKVIEALTGGACGYLIKPIEHDELLFQVGRGLERREMLIDKRQYTRQLEERVRQQTAELRQSCEETIHRLVAACAYRDVETGGHSWRTGLLSEVLALAADWSVQDAEHIRLAAPIHDVGKIGIPDAILRKPGRLTADEFEIMKRHTIIGAEMLADSESPTLQLARTIALCHHEKWNGRGYPAGLAGNQIPQAARIVGIVDVYDALTHARVYRESLSEAEALSVMIEKSGSHFDPDLLELFLSRLPEMRQISEQFRDDPDPASLPPLVPCQASPTGAVMAP